ncbi:MAG: hypothetical protein MZV63_33975 [Marinilabiliales bacterium]|nr:hypothetical protein [Marinilabiliales bacterium]
MTSHTDYILTQEAYYLSAAADRVYINPEGTMGLSGLSAEVMSAGKPSRKWVWRFR